jgi:hypothetical protein
VRHDVTEGQVKVRKRNNGKGFNEGCEYENDRVKSQEEVGMWWVWSNERVANRRRKDISAKRM